MEKYMFNIWGKSRAFQSFPAKHCSDIMKVKEILNALEEFAPLALQDGYDNAGLQIGLAEDADATGALLCLDVTEDVMDEAIRQGCNLIISHHPLMFHPLKSISGNDSNGRVIIKAVKKDIAIYAAHTNLDSAYGGVNFKLAEKLGLKNVKWLVGKGVYQRDGLEMTSGEGLIGELSAPIDSKDFMERVKETFGIRSLRVNGYEGRTVGRIALCGGSGAHLIQAAMEKGADAFLTGEIGYHRFFGYEKKMLLLEMGHYESEQFTLELFAEIVSKAAPDLPVLCTEVKTNPINYL